MRLSSVQMFASLSAILALSAGFCRIGQAEDEAAPASAISVENRPVVVARALTPEEALVQHPTIQRLVQLTNEHRARMGLAPVRINAKMCLDAQRHAQWMAATGAFQHSGLPYMEIIFQGVPNSDAAINGWINSPAHHAIMLSGTEVGFGYMTRNGYPYWVGVFR
jgi:hypothetical protein